MIEVRTHIKQWVVFWYFFVDDYCQKEILSRLKSVGASNSVIVKAREKMLNGRKNEGFTYSNLSKKKSVVVIGESTNGGEFLNSFSHELRHLADDISSYYGMIDRGEEVAYLTGELANSVSDIVCLLSCDCCRNKR